MEPERKQQILAHVERWLDRFSGLGGSEPLPEELDPERTEAATLPGDLASLAASATASAHELKLQGKTFHELKRQLARLPDSLESLPGRFAELEKSLGARLETTHRESHDADLRRERAEGRRAGIADLIQIHDRLTRTAVEARRSTGALSWLARRAGAARVVVGVAEGVELVLARLEEILEDAGVRRFATTGQEFDPHTMRAVDTVRAEPQRPAGCVVETVRAGFLRGEELLRAADVRLAR